MTNINLISSQNTIVTKAQFANSAKPTVATTAVSTRFSVSIDAQSDPLKLAYQAAIDRINEEVAPFLGQYAIQRGYESGLDVSPSGTADRIVNQSTRMFSAFQQQHAGEPNEAVVEKFVTTLTSGVERGFAEAKEILSGLGVLEGEIETNIDLTFDLVLYGLNEFAGSRRAG